MAYQKIIVEREDGIVVIKLNNPERLNAVDAEMNREMNEELARAEADPDSRVIILTGVGKGFCAGFDMRIMQAAGREPAAVAPDHPYQARIVPTLRWGRGLRDLDIPTIAAVNGYSLSSLALRCDIRIASEEAKFCFMYTRRGLSPSEGSSTLLPQIVGISKALEMAFTSDFIDGREAERIGLVSKCVPHDQLMPTAMELARKIAKNPPIAMGLTKYVMYKSLEMSVEDNMVLANVAHTETTLTEDHKEGVRAYAEKREPKFQGK